MKKVLAILVVATLVSCGSNESTTAENLTITVTVNEMDSTVTDSTAVSNITVTSVTDTDSTATE